MKTEVEYEQMKALISCGMTVAAALHVMGRDDVLVRVINQPSFRKQVASIIAVRLVRDLEHGSEDDYKAMVDAILAVS